LAHQTKLLISVAAVAAAVATFSSPLTTYAQDAAAQAALLSRDAESLLAAGKTNEACAKYDESAKLDRRGSAILDLALCREKQGRLGTAYVLYEEAEKKAVEEKRNDRVVTAKQKKNVLFAKVPRLTVNVAKDGKEEDLKVTVGPVVIPPGEYGKAYPVDPGDQEVVASANGRTEHRTRVSIGPGQRKAISIPVLAAAGGAPPPKKADEPKKDEPKKADEPKKEDPKNDEPQASEPPPETEDDSSAHRDSGFVVDLGLLFGLNASFVDRGFVGGIGGTEYRYASTDGGEFIGACADLTSVPGAGECEATFDSALDLMMGGQLFIGYGFTDSFQLGGRGFLATRFGSGFHFAGGPSFSLNVVGPLWLGGTFLLGTTVYDTTVTGGRGSIPDDLEEANGASEIAIPKEDLAGGFANPDAKGRVRPGFMLGGSLEVSVNLFDWKPVDALSGSLMASAWPGLLVDVDGSGTSLVIPIGIGYRFY